MSDLFFLAITVRRILVIINILAVVAIIAIIAYRVFSLRRNPETKEPQNLEPFYEDEDLEGRKLERVLGWALLFTALIAIALPLYFVFEPTRQSTADDDFEERAAERGSILFANEESPEFDSTVSLLCANCHGVDGGGGAALYTLQPEGEDCNLTEAVDESTPEECRPVQVTWQAPSLNDVMSRFTPAQVTQIVTFGRPGTPMPAWGVESGKGVLNEQSIDDIVTYLETIQVSSDEAREKATQAIEDAIPDAEAAVEDAQTALTEAEAALAAATTPDEQEAAEADVEEAEYSIDAATAWVAQLEEAGEGGIIFMQQCARCHTKGWSYYNPLDPDAAPLPGEMGGGAFGPSLIGVSDQFPGANGIENQMDWVANGAEPNEPYGIRGISSGRMPHFGTILDEDQIEAVVVYERSL